MGFAAVMKGREALRRRRDGDPCEVHSRGSRALSGLTNIRNLRMMGWALEFIEAPYFSKLLAEYPSDEDYRQLQLHLARDPEAGDVIQGTGGFRKVRWADRRRGQGKRGGLRVIYYYFEQDRQLWFLTIYGKDEAATLTPREKRVLKAAVEDENRQRARRRGSRKG
jgi:hypothetical protein